MTDVTGSHFNPELTQVINRVYERAIDALGLTSMQYERRAMLGRLLLDRVADGETDETRLYERAVAAMRRFEWLRNQAHERWEMEGRPHGRDREHWAQAESEWAKQDREQ